MIRVVFVLSLAIIATLHISLSAQDPAAQGQPAPVPDAVSKLSQQLKSYRDDAPVRPIDVNPASLSVIEEALKQTELITIRFGGYQVTMPIVSDVALSKIAAVILLQARDLPETKLHVGRTALLIMPKPESAEAIVQAIVKVMFVDGGERPLVTNHKPTDGPRIIGLPDGLPPGTWELTDVWFEQALRKAETLDIGMGTYIITVTLPEKSPHARLGREIVKLIKQDSTIQVINGRKYLILEAPLASTQSIVKTVVGALVTALDPFLSEVDGEAKPEIAAPTVSEAPAEPAGTPDPDSVPPKDSDPPASGGLGGGGVVGDGRSIGGLSPLPQKAMPSKRYVSAHNIVIAIGDKGDRAWGYSLTLGKWTTVNFEKSYAKINPVVGQGIGCVYNEVLPSDADQTRYVWGYSPTTGTWEKLKLPAESKATPQVGSDQILIETGDDISLFSGRTGKWASPPKPGDESATAAVVGLQPGSESKFGGELAANDPGDSVLQVLKLKHVPATDLAVVLKELFRDPTATIVADRVSNSILVRGSDEVQRSIAMLITTLDVAPTEVAGATAVDSSKLTFAAIPNDGQDISKLKDQYDRQEQKADTIARQIRNTPSPTADQKAKLRQAVSDAFAQRQQLHRAELAAFQRRMMKVQQTIATRDQLKVRIIDRRVEDLLDPDLSWDGSAAPAVINQQSATSQQTVAPQSELTKPIIVAPVNPPSVAEAVTEPIPPASELDGVWVRESISNNPNPAAVAATATIQGSSMMVTSNGQQALYLLITNPLADPKTLDLFIDPQGNSSSHISQGIYQLEGDTLTIAYGKRSTSRPARFDRPDTIGKIETWRRTGDIQELVQLNMRSPKGAMLTTFDQQGNPIVGSKSKYPLPTQRLYESGKTRQFMLSDIPNHAGVEQHFSIEFPAPTEDTRDDLKYTPVPLEITDEDLNQAQAGNFVVKVIYLANPQAGGFKPLLSSVETLVSTRVGPGVDVVTEARKRGTVLAVVRFGNRSTAAFSPPREPESRTISTAAVPLTTAVREFNARCANDADRKYQSPLTDEEVVAAIRWADRHELIPEFDGAELQTLRDIAQERVIPAGWHLNKLHLPVGSDVNRTRPQSMAEPAWSKAEKREIVSYIVLSHAPSPFNSGLKSAVAQVKSRVIRKQVLGQVDFLGPPFELPPLSPAMLDPGGIPLASAIHEFNESNDTIAGEKQLPLTEHEVIAAIHDWKSRRKESPVTNQEFADFLAIADRRQLSAGVKFELLKNFQPGDHYTYEIWSVRILVPRPSKPGWTYAFTIRERFVRSKQTKDEEISWGPAAASGFQAGVRFEPHGETYARGQQVTPTYYFRNTGKNQLKATFPNVITHRHYDALHAMDPAGNKLAVDSQGGEAAIVGYQAVSLEPNARHEVRGMPLVVGNVPADYSKVETVIRVDAGQQCRVRFTLDNYADSNAPKVDTGEIRFTVVEIDRSTSAAADSQPARKNEAAQPEAPTFLRD